MKFRVNFDNTSGAIVSYQEGGEDDQNLAPDGCSTLVFAEVFRQIWDANFNICMKVDLATKQLVFINPVVIPQPIDNTTP